MYPTVSRGLLLAGLALAGLACALWGRAAVRAQDADPTSRLGRQEVRTEIDDRHQLAVTTVRQELLNDSRSEAARSCVLPIAAEGTLLRFTVLSPPARAKEKPEERGAVQAAGRGLCNVTVHRVPARGRAQVELVYAESLTRRGDRRKYIYPILDQAAAPASLGFEARVTARGAPQRAGSATHPLTVRRPASNVVTLTYDSADRPDGRDLALEYQLPPSAEDAEARLSVLTPPDGGQSPYFLLSLPAPATLLRGAARQDEPLDVVFCMDVSGSTRGRKLDAVQEAVSDGLADLTPRDRFTVIAFDDDTRAFRRRLMPAGEDAIRQATRFVNRLRVGGGSDPDRALREAAEILLAKRAAGRRAVVALLVDNEDRSAAGGAIARASLSGRGIRVALLGALEDARLVSYRTTGRRLQGGSAIALSRAAVAYGSSLSRAGIDVGPLNVSYVYPPPDRLPDVPLSTPILLFGRLNEAPPARGSVTLSGNVDGKPRKLEVAYRWSPLPPGAPLAALWADRRLRRLHQLAGRDGTNSNELIDAAGRIREEYGLLMDPSE